METTSKFKLTVEKELLIGLIVSNDFIKQIAPILNVAYLQASSSKLIARWCLDYYDNYSKAPSELIQDIYLQNKSQLNEEDSIIIAKVLSHISETYASTEKDKFNIPYMIDKASNYIRQRRLVLLQEQLDHDIVTNNLDKAENAILSYNRISKVSYRETNLWKKDVSGIFNTESYQLFKMPKALGQLQGYFRRGNLYAYAGVAKRGKSRWLAQTAAVASLNRCKVLYISLEMDEVETDDLLLNAFIRSPLNKEASEPIEVTIPRFSEENTILYDTVQMNPPTEKMYHKYQKKLSMLCAPMHTVIGEPNNMTLENIEEQILSLEYLHGFQPDVVCIAEGSLVLTEKRGLVPIEQIKLSDKLWDGENWVSHDGLVYKGKKEVIKYGNIEATPDHLFWTEEGWRSLESCKELGLRIAQTECNGKGIRIGENYISYSESKRKKQDTKRAKTVWVLCLREMWEMWKGKMDKLWEFKKRHSKRVQNMYANKTPKRSSNVVVAQSTGTIYTVQSRKPCIMERLWKAWNRIPIQKYFRCMYVDKREFRDSKRQEARIGQNKQQWTLRTRKSKMVNKKAELSPHKKTYGYGKSISFPSIVSVCKICRQHITKIFKRNDTRGSSRKMESMPLQKKRVWDIRNAGPLHRFTVQGVLAHNCVDYADILSGKGYDSRDRVNNIWIGLKALAKKYHCAIITATHMNGEALKKDGEDYNIGEDKRKLNHVSGMYILNQTEEEKRDKIMRVKAVATRFGEYTSLDEVVVLYNYAAGRTYIDCRFKSEVKEYQE